MSSLDYCVISSRSTFIPGSSREKPSFVKVPTCSTDISNIINVGDETEILKDTLNNIAKLRTLKSSDGSLDITNSLDEIDLIVGVIDGGIF